MAEGQQAKTSKRARVAKFKGAGIGYSGDWFVCTYCGSTTEMALVPKDIVGGVAFCTYRCGVAWLQRNAPEAEREGMLTAFATACEQKAGMTPPAPDTKDLMQWGGDLGRDQWMPDAELWDQLTIAKGVTAAQARKPARSKGTKAAAGASFTFEVGVYSIGIGKGAPKKLETAEDSVKAQRKRNTFVAKNNNYVVQHFDGPKYSVSSCGATEPDAAHLNNIASQLVGFNVYGPAYAVFTTKVALKL